MITASGSPNALLVFGLVVLAVLSIGALWAAFRVMRDTRLIENLATAKIRSAAQGYVEITGTAHWLPGEKILSPLTQTECVWWSYDITHRGRDSRGPLVRVDQRDCHGPFLLKDDTGQCVVDPLGAELLGSDLKAGGDLHEWYGTTAMPAPGSYGSATKPAAGAELIYRYQERVIKCGTPLHVVGHFRTQCAVPDRSRDVSAAEGTHTLSKPELGDKRFIISTRSQRELSDGSRGLAGFLFACFLVSGALLVWAIAGLWQGKPERQIVFGFVSAFCLVLFILSAGPFVSGIRILLGMPAASSDALAARRSRWAAIPLLAFALLMGAFTGFACYLTAVEAGLVGMTP
jgi:hypothetical protein